MTTACVFAHYDPHDRVDEHVLYYLRELGKVVDHIQFVTTAVLSDAEAHKLETLPVNVIQRENEGYDFCSYKLGIDHTDLSRFDELVLCNDSVYGPFTALHPVFEKMRTRGADVWGLTDSVEYQRHLQSYFLVFSGDALKSDAFGKFWQNVQALNDKTDIIRQYEVGLSRTLEAAGFTLESLATSQPADSLRHVKKNWHYYFAMFMRRWKDRQFWVDGLRVVSGTWQVGDNVSHTEWLSLIADHGVPFVKVELLRDNPRAVDNLDGLFELIERVGDYPVKYIRDHLQRTGGSRNFN